MKSGPQAPGGGVRHQQLDLLAMVLLTVLCASWGLAQVAIKVANTGISPVLQSGLRSAGGAVLVLGWCWARGIPLFARDGTLAAGIIAGVCMTGAPELQQGSEQGSGQQNLLLNRRCRKR